MTFDLQHEEGYFLVKLSRQAIEHFLRFKIKTPPPKDSPMTLQAKSRVFVTLNTFENGQKSLRGCIGYPEPTLPLVEATIDAAINSAVNDPRFPPVSYGEMKNILVEVTVLTLPELIRVTDPRQYLSKIEVGGDGLIVEQGYLRGLLLPQVPVEWNWDAEEFLSNCCMKAGLLPDAWFEPNTKVYKFQGVIYAEETPNGAISKARII